MRAESIYQQVNLDSAFYGICQMTNSFHPGGITGKNVRLKVNSMPAVTDELVSPVKKIIPAFYQLNAGCNVP